MTLELLIKRYYIVFERTDENSFITASQLYVLDSCYGWCPFSGGWWSPPYNHFGNPTVKVQHGFSPLGHDLITLQDYDALNRASKLWLPVAYGSSDGSYVNPGKLSQTARSFFLYGMDSHPYSLTVYDGSALNEVVEEYARLFHLK